MAVTDLPQLQMDHEDKFTRVPNAMLEALAQVRLSSCQYRICHFILRRTYGWHHNYDCIALSSIAAVCGGSKQYISRQIIDLVDKNILRRLSHENGMTNFYAWVPDPAQWDQECFDYSKWLTAQGEGLFRCAPTDQLEKAEQMEQEIVTVDGLGSYEELTEGSFQQLTVGSYQELTFNHDQAVAPPGFQPPLKKELKKNKERRIFTDDSVEFELCQLLLIKIKEHLPQFKPPDMQKWARMMDFIIRLDKHPPEEVRQVILYAQADLFWSTNIISPASLRQYYDRLNLKRLQKQIRPVSNRVRGMGSNDDWEIESEEYAHFFDRSRDKA